MRALVTWLVDILANMVGPAIDKGSELFNLDTEEDE